MKENIKKNFYSGQALALVMCFLVVAFVIGMSIMTRMNKSKDNVVEGTQDQEVYNILGNISQQFVSLNNDDLYRSLSLEKEVTLYDVDDVNNYFEKFDTVFNSDLLLRQCSQDRTRLKINLELANDNYLEIAKNGVLIYTLGTNATMVENPCNMSFKFQLRGEESAKFLIHRIYAKDYPTPVYKTYQSEDVDYYCLSQRGDCENPYFENSLQELKVDDPVLIDLYEDKEGYHLDSIKIIPIDGDIAIQSKLSARNCAGGFDERFIHVVTSLTCDKYGGDKEIYIPYKKDLTYTSIFDYTVYKDLGILIY